MSVDRHLAPGVTTSPWALFVRDAARHLGPFAFVKPSTLPMCSFRCGSRRRAEHDGRTVRGKRRSNQCHKAQRGTTNRGARVLKDHDHWDYALCGPSTGAVRPSALLRPIKPMESSDVPPTITINLGRQRLAPSNIANDLAEGVGFEPTVPLPARWFSRPVHSTALPSFRADARSGPKPPTE